MTKEEFKKLKVGNIVYFRATKHQRSLCSEVMKIDRIFGKIEALCKNGPRSYKSVSRKRIPTELFVGVYPHNYGQQ